MSSSHIENTSQGRGVDEHIGSNGVVDANGATAAQLYDPGPSFAGIERPAERLAQMPAWLQTFAAVAGDPAEDELVAEPRMDVSAATVALEDTPSDEPVELPSWLTEERAAVAAEPVEPERDAAGDAAIGAAAAATLISEDDLPEWLRAISSNDDDGHDELFSFGAEAGDAGSQRAVLTAPSVARAWQFMHDQPALSEGASIFALVARETIATALPAPAAGSATTAVSDAPFPARAAAQRGESLAAPVRADQPAEQAERATTAGRPRWMIYLLALLLVVAVLVLLRFIL